MPDQEIIELKRTINQQQIIFYLRSCKYFRFPFFDPSNCYRRDGLFPQLENVLNRIGERLSRDYGGNFLSINLRGSWLRGIPIHGDDVDVLFIVKDLPDAEKKRIHEYTRQTLRQENRLFRMCEGKSFMGEKVDPIVFLDISQLGLILNSYMYGLGHFLQLSSARNRDDYQDSFFGSKLREKKTQFLKSGILIPYVGWIYGRDRKKEVFDEIGRNLPSPTRATSAYAAAEVEETKETIRAAFIGRNLIYPSLEIKKWADLKKAEVDDVHAEALHLYRALAPLEDIHARAVVNYIYTIKIEEQLLGKVLTRERILKFAPTYDNLVDDILKKAVIRLAACTPIRKHDAC